MRALPYNPVATESVSQRTSSPTLGPPDVGGALLTPMPSARCRIAGRGDPVGLRDSLTALMFSNPALNRRSGRDRRASPRFQTEVVCEEKLPGGRHYRLTWDLSTFGLSTQFGPQYALGTRLDIVLHLPDDVTGPVAVVAEVVGVNEESGGIRLAFRNPSGVAVRRIHRYLSGQTPDQLGPCG